MRVANHRIDEIWFNQTSNVSANVAVAPRFVVMHYTTGWDGVGSRNWLLGRAGGHAESQVSAHVVIDRDGTAWQICPFNRRSWHAGPSRYGTVVDLNSHAIGIEFVNPGWLQPDGTGKWIDYFKNVRTDAQLQAFGGFIEARHPRVGSALYRWPLFPEAQIAKGLEVFHAIREKYSIEAVLTHEEIDTRGWKTDPGPAFPMGRFTQSVEDNDSGTITADYVVNATRLNIRGGPGTEHETINPPGALARGTRVKISRQEGDWAYVEVATIPAGTDAAVVGVMGWVHAGYLLREL